MPIERQIFLDTSALFAGIWSATGGTRMLFKLGEAGAVKLLISSHVSIEIDGVIRRKSPTHFATFTHLLEQSQVAIVDDPPSDLIERCTLLTAYAADGIVLAAAWNSHVDFFVTLDREHFLANQLLQSETPFPVGTPGDCLAWYRSLLSLAGQ